MRELISKLVSGAKEVPAPSSDQLAREEDFRELAARHARIAKRRGDAHDRRNALRGQLAALKDEKGADLEARIGAHLAESDPPNFDGLKAELAEADRECEALDAASGRARIAMEEGRRRLASSVCKAAVPRQSAAVRKVAVALAALAEADRELAQISHEISGRGLSINEGILPFCRFYAGEFGHWAAIGSPLRRWLNTMAGLGYLTEVEAANPTLIEIDQ